MTSDLVENKLSFVLPVALRELLRGTWLRSPDAGVAARTRLTLAAFAKHFNHEDLLDFYLICPGADRAELSQIVGSITNDSRYRVVDEIEWCPDLPKALNANRQPVAGWIAQQLIKLASAAHIRSSHFVTFDSDILCLKPFSHADLVRDGRALTNRETISDYRRIYTPSFCDQELQTKMNRYRASAEILGRQRLHDISRRFYGETPVVLHTQSVGDLTAFLSERLQQPWLPGLASRKGWTEYSLYYQFLEMMGRLDALCSFTGCNGVLDLERSVWQTTGSYLHPRPYDARHFTSGDPGFFVAIQSWIPFTKWLPPRHPTLEAFYQEVESWLL